MNRKKNSQNNQMPFISLLVRNQKPYPYQRTFSISQVILTGIAEYLNLNENPIADEKNTFKKIKTFV